MRPSPATPCLSKYRGKRYFKYDVVISQEWLESDLNRIEQSVQVIAAKPDDAVNLVKDEIGWQVARPTTIATAGPKGGITSRFIGWESMVWQTFLHRPEQHQLTLQFK